MKETSKRILGGVSIGLAVILSFGAIALSGKALGWFGSKDPVRPEPTLEALNFDETGYGTYSVSLKDYTATEVVIPSEYNGKAVTEIGGYSALQAMCVMNSFIASSKTEDIEKGMTDMYGAMTGSGIPTEAGHIGFGAAVKLEKVTIPESIKIINDCAFFGCIGLTEIEIPDSVVKIGNNAFRNATGLTNVKLPERLENCGSYAFSNCRSLINIHIPAMTVIPIGMFKYTGLKRIEIPAGVKTISGYAFRNCENLTEMVLPNTLESIGEETFYSCNQLSEILLPEKLEIIETNAFQNCSGLKTIYNLSRLPLTKNADTFGGVAKSAENIYTELPSEKESAKK